MAAKGKQFKTLGLVFGQNLRSRREAMGYTREELAELSHLSPQNIAKIENGDRFVTLVSLENLAQSVGCDPYELFMPQQMSDKESDAIRRVQMLLKSKSEKEVEFAHQILALLFKGP
ncbi:helix-turn-helix domain-containing protein [Bdellovibrio sp. HCB2-146]|uniref:helix-turn-helix domain-containing protein n=1 Tax=Bdellovibrio sp. HCB2-146 TaxID=3394362 RepID=UPI0039BD7EE9